MRADNMVSVIIAVVGGSRNSLRHYEDTILHEVDFLSDPYSTLLGSELEVLRGLFPSGRARFWGMKPGNRNDMWFRRLSPGDVAIFTGRNRLISATTVVHKFDNSELAASLWGENNSETWTHMYALEGLQEIGVSYDHAFNLIEPHGKFNTQGTNVITDQRAGILVSAFYTNRTRALEEIEEEEYRYLLENGTLDKEVTTKSRVEQPYLKRRLFGNSSSQDCALCKRNLPVEILRAAHIKKRSLCSIEEKLDFDNIVMSACILGCDALYEDGWVRVDSDGSILEGKGRGRLTPDLNELIKQIIGRKCSAHSSGSSTYFLWHYNKWS